LGTEAWGFSEMNKWLDVKTRLSFFDQLLFSSDDAVLKVNFRDFLEFFEDDPK
jgi:hypothetical protein